MERKMIAIDEVSFFFRWIRASGVIAFSATRSDLRAFDSSKDEEIIFAVFNYRDCAKSTEARHFLSFIMFPFKTWTMIVFFFFSGKTIRSSALTWRSRTSLWKITGSTNAKLATEWTRRSRYPLTFIDKVNSIRRGLRETQRVRIVGEK